jgi:hypothetical protein
MSHRLGGRSGRGALAMLVKRCERLAHDLGLGAAALPRNALD